MARQHIIDSVLGAESNEPIATRGGGSVAKENFIDSVLGTESFPTIASNLRLSIANDLDDLSR